MKETNMKKKMFIILALFVGPLRPAHADGPKDQFLASLLQHVVGITEFTTHGDTKLEFIDGIIQFGHYKDDYIMAIDGGFCNSLAPDAQGRLSTTWGAHAHLLAPLYGLTGINPALLDTFKMLELTPRWSYDTDVHKGVFGVTFGARIPF